MADTVDIDKLHEPGTPVTNPNSLTYIWAIVIVTLFGVILTGTILYLRPLYDPLVVIAAVAGMGSTFSASLLALMKAQETHLTVNSQLTAWKAEHSRMDHAEGIIAGIKGEQERIVEQKLQTAVQNSIPIPEQVITKGSKDDRKPTVV